MILLPAKTLLGSKRVSTPFGKVETPIVELPPLGIPRLDEHYRKAMGHTIGIDLSGIVGLVPYVGDVIADNIGAMHSAELKRILTPGEYDEYVRWDKTYPDTIALLRSVF